jgi:hypothetical protein
MFFKYYELNVGKELVGKYCKIIKWEVWEIY